MKKIRQLSLMKQVTIFSTIVTVLAFLVTIPCFWFNLMEIPLGILLGGAGSIFSFSLFIFKEDAPYDKSLVRLNILFIVLMAIIHISTIILAGCLYYLLNLHIFNIFATFGASFIGLLVFIVLSLLHK